MSCFLSRNIKHTCEYNPGGISEIYLLDMRDFITYRFKDDGLYDKPFVDAIFRPSESRYISLQTVQESNYTEQKDAKGVYIQSLSTFVHTLDADKLENLLVAEANAYIVVFKTLQGTWFTFGADEGASLSFSQITGQTGETGGYNITLSVSSAYPLFEAAHDVLAFKYNTTFVPDFNYFKCEMA